MSIKLIQVSKFDLKLRSLMEVHYSKPKGFVGRSLCYNVYFNNIFYGSIVGGSATLHLPGRNEFFDVTKLNLKNIVNNIFYHIEKVDGKYPTRNFTVKVLDIWCKKITKDWRMKYRTKVLGFESLIELPRSGELYKRAGWTLVGETVGYTCKRTAGIGTDSWTGKRVWNTKDLYPKLVFCKINNTEEEYSEYVYYLAGLSEERF